MHILVRLSWVFADRKFIGAYVLATHCVCEKSYNSVCGLVTRFKVVADASDMEVDWGGDSVGHRLLPPLPPLRPLLVPPPVSSASAGRDQEAVLSSALATGDMADADVGNGDVEPPLSRSVSCLSFV